MTISVAAALITLIKIVNIASIIFAVLYIVFSCRYYNEKVSASMYFLAVIAPLIAVIVQLSRKKHYQGEGMNVCRQFGEKVPPTYEVCPRCLVPLEPYVEENKNKDKKLSRIMLTVFWIGKAVSIVCIVVISAFSLSSAFSALSESDGIEQRMSFNVDGQEVYYDKKGISYDAPADVVLYARDGTKYVYDSDTACYIGENNDEYESAYCYVDSKGWFYYDADDSLIYGDPESDDLDYYDDETFLAMDFSDLFTDMFSLTGNEVWYDEDGNVYYWADTASWNEKGELITVQYEAIP
ncbi:MAG: hypothetical protein ACI4SB_01140 [Acutalibacteraceae bacterium]